MPAPTVWTLSPNRVISFWMVATRICFAGCLVGAFFLAACERTHQARAVTTQRIVAQQSAAHAPMSDPDEAGMYVAAAQLIAVDGPATLMQEVPARMSEDEFLDSAKQSCSDLEQFDEFNTGVHPRLIRALSTPLGLFEVASVGGSAGTTYHLALRLRDKQCALAETKDAALNISVDGGAAGTAILLADYALSFPNVANLPVGEKTSRARAIGLLEAFAAADKDRKPGPSDAGTQDREVNPTDTTTAPGGRSTAQETFITARLDLPWLASPKALLAKYPFGSCEDDRERTICSVKGTKPVTCLTNQTCKSATYVYDNGIIVGARFILGAEAWTDEEALAKALIGPGVISERVRSGDICSPELTQTFATNDATEELISSSCYGNAALDKWSDKVIQVNRR